MSKPDLELTADSTLRRLRRALYRMGAQLIYGERVKARLLLFKGRQGYYQPHEPLLFRADALGVNAGLPHLLYGV